MLSEEEKLRYQRQILIDNWGPETQEEVKDLTVFVAGAGGSGSPIITQLALLGVGTIRICDFDVVELSNLNRQFIHSVRDESSIGVKKALSAKKTVKNINPNIKVEIITQKITESNVSDIVGETAIIFDSVDDIATKFSLSKCAVQKRIPHLYYGMMDINAFFSIFYSPKTPCFHCLHDFNKTKEQRRYSLLSKSLPRKGTPVCAPALFLSTGIAVTEALKIILGIGSPMYNFFYFFALKGNNRISKSRGFINMKYWLSDYFKEVSLEHGFDWDKGWRNNFIEEIPITKDPMCLNCGDIA